VVGGAFFGNPLSLSGGCVSRSRRWRWVNTLGVAGSRLYSELLFDTDFCHVAEGEDCDFVVLDELDERASEIAVGAVPPVADVVEPEL